MDEAERDVIRKSIKKMNSGGKKQKLDDSSDDEEDTKSSKPGLGAGLSRAESASREPLAENTLDLLEKVQSGSFLPAIAAAERGQLDVLKPIDNQSGLTLLHYACFYGHVKALRYIFNKVSIMGHDEQPKDCLQRVRNFLLIKDTIDEET